MINAAFQPASVGRPPSVVVNPASYEAMGGSFRTVASGTFPASAVYPTASLSFGYPFSVSEPITALSLYLVNGAAVSGNVDLGIYNGAGTLLVSKGSTAQAGTSVKQILDTTNLDLYPGVQYYMFIAIDNTTATTVRWVSAAALLASIGCVQVAANFPLATGVTFALMTNAYLPLYGYSQLATY